MSAGWELFQLNQWFSDSASDISTHSVIFSLINDCHCFMACTAVLPMLMLYLPTIATSSWLLSCASLWHIIECFPNSTGPWSTNHKISWLLGLLLSFSLSLHNNDEDDNYEYYCCKHIANHIWQSYQPSLDTAKYLIICSSTSSSSYTPLLK